jgi:hypothetical protein
MEKKKTWNEISKKGEFIKKKIIQLFKKYKIDGQIKGINSIIKINYEKDNIIKQKFFLKKC